MRVFPCPLLGTEVGLPDRVERIVSLSPSLTDCVARLGLEERLVGRSAWCWRPEGIERLPVVGSYTGVRREVLDRLAPDLILMTSGVQEPLARELSRAGQPVYVVPLPVTLWGILDNLATVALIAGEADAAFGPLGRLHDAVGALRDILEPRPTYVEIDLGGAVTCGRGSYAYWALRWMGLSPLIPPGDRAWSTPGSSWLASLRPDIMVYDPQPGQQETAESVRDRLMVRGLEDWLERGIEIVVTGGNVLAHYGPRLLEEGLPALAKRLRR
ncbi:MAG: ABC transporter substrate-binding protein [Acidobacteria bacterium]|nr:ABC transporter substrate-binding protein [Acidobacteriota bacterium]